MPARILDGSRLAEEIRAEVRAHAAAYASRAGRPPALAIVLVGEHAASEIYVRNKMKAAGAIGVAVSLNRLPATASLDEILAVVDTLNASARYDGILVQSPLPEALGPEAMRRVFDAINPLKDVDGFHPVNVGRLMQGRARLKPCTPAGVIELLDREQLPIAGQHAVVIGRSDIVGKPVSLLLLQRDATVTICHSKTPNLQAVAATADILIAAIGRAAFVTRQFVKPGATVIDVGISRITDPDLARSIVGGNSPGWEDFTRRGQLIIGDVHPEVSAVAGAMTPVPGGVGPLTIAMLLKNTVLAAEHLSPG